MSEAISSAGLEPRPVGLAVRRGFACRCPRCGEGRLYRAYLKVADVCPVCGLDLTPQRADDAPAYLTMLIVGHFAVAGVLVQDDWLPNAPLLPGAVIWAVFAAALSLWLLPRIKGALVGYQWATRMHGFGRSEPEPT